jgi:hypothetical protein
MLFLISPVIPHADLCGLMRTWINDGIIATAAVQTHCTAGLRNGLMAAALMAAYTGHVYAESAVSGQQLHNAPGTGYTQRAPRLS